MKIEENKIKEYSGTSFSVTKTNGVSKIDFGDKKYIENTNHYGKVFLGDCDPCTKIKALYNNFTFDKILIGGLGLGLLPEYAKSVKNCSIIDVVENNQELIDYVDYLESPINIIKGDALSYTPDKKYDLILIDLWWEEEDVTQEIQDNIKNNYNSYLETNGKIILPLLEKQL
tara:strand:+ start:11379 stop:11894 length:516 start_codon:yes stop_codon:yes gene_type:complete